MNAMSIYTPPPVLSPLAAWSAELGRFVLIPLADEDGTDLYAVEHPGEAAQWAIFPRGGDLDLAVLDDLADVMRICPTTRAMVGPELVGVGGGRQHRLSGLRFPGMVFVGLEGGRDPRDTLAHEMLHEIFRRLPDDVRDVLTVFGDAWRDADAAHDYPLGSDANSTEAEAQAFGLWAAEQSFPSAVSHLEPPPEVLAVWQALREGQFANC